jgi:large-conductance mechanosensitive channel
MVKITASQPPPRRNKSLRQTLGHFLTAGDLLPLILAVYLGDVLAKFFGSISQGIIAPVLQKIHLTYFIRKAGLDADSKKKHPKKLRDWSMDVWGMNLEVGEVVDGFIRLMLAVWVAYTFSHYFIKGYLNN